MYCKILARYVQKKSCEFIQEDEGEPHLVVKVIFIVHMIQDGHFFFHRDLKRRGISFFICHFFLSGRRCHPCIHCCVEFDFPAVQIPEVDEHTAAAPVKLGNTREQDRLTFNYTHTRVHAHTHIAQLTNHNWIGRLVDDKSYGITCHQILTWLRHCILLLQVVQN